MSQKEENRCIRFWKWWDFTNIDTPEQDYRHWIIGVLCFISLVLFIAYFSYRATRLLYEPTVALCYCPSTWKDEDGRNVLDVSIRFGRLCAGTRNGGTCHPECLEEVEGYGNEDTNTTVDRDILLRSTAWKRICMPDITLVKNHHVCPDILTNEDTFAKNLYYTENWQNVIEDVMVDHNREYSVFWFNCSGEQINFPAFPFYYCQKVQEPCSALSTLPETIETIGSSFGTVTLILVPAYLLFSTIVCIFTCPKSRKPQSPNNQPVKSQNDQAVKLPNLVKKP
jgi:hypothetical protein